MKIEISPADLSWVLRGFVTGLVNTPSGGYARPAYELALDIVKTSEFNEADRKTLELEFTNIMRRKNGLVELVELSSYQTL